MIRKTWLTVSVVAPTAIGMFVPSTLFAQHGPGTHGPGFVLQPQGPAYDTTSEATFKGTVADLKGGRSALYWFSRIHTLGLGHMRAPDKQFLLKTDTGTVEIQLGPTAFLTDQKVAISEGDMVEVIGSRVTIGESQVVLAREIRKGDNTWVLRDATGQPLWSSGPTELRGFWTKKKVLLTVVVVKVVLLTTVLRH